MYKSNTYTIAVTAETNFLEGWTDERVPNMEFMFDQESIDECEEIDGVFYATYQSYVVEESRTMTFIEPDGTKTTITIPPGEYGIKQTETP
jgi:hypothetical protein